MHMSWWIASGFVLASRVSILHLSGFAEGSGGGEEARDVQAGVALTSALRLIREKMCMRAWETLRPGWINLLKKLHVLGSPLSPCILVQRQDSQNIQATCQREKYTSRSVERRKTETISEERCYNFWKPYQRNVVQIQVV